MSSPTKRLIAGIGANGYGQLANMLIQLASLPVFLHVWDLETYGLWLTVTAVPSYLAMADVGMVTVAGNRMTMLASAGQEAAANRVFQSAQAFVLCTGAVVTAISVLLLLSGALDVSQQKDLFVALILLVIITVLGFANGLSAAVYKSTKRYARGTMLEANARLFDWLGGVIGLVVGGTFTSVAAGMLVTRATSAVLLARSSTRYHPELRWGIRDADRAEILGMIRPSLAFASFPLTNAVSIQGFTLIASGALGPASVAIFNAYRTIARIAVQATSVFSHALWPELSRLYGEKQNARLRRVLSQAFVLGAVAAVGTSLATYFLAPTLLARWAHGKVPFAETPMALLLCYAAIAGVSHVPRVALIATNKHVRMAFYSLIFSFLGLLIGWGSVTYYGIAGLAFALVVSELLILAWSVTLMVQGLARTTENATVRLA